MGNLPPDIIIHILSRLPVKSLLRFKCVCKSWCSIISDPQFIRTHLNLARERLILTSPSLRSFYSVRYEENNDAIAVELDFPVEKNSYDEVTYFGSCNGLLCLSPEPDTFLLFNPSTRESRKVPKVKNDCFPFSRYLTRAFTHGFGYDHSVDDYKFVKIALGIYVLVYSLKTNTWKGVQDFPYNSHGSDPEKPLNGALHWIVSRTEDWQESQLIGAYDLAEEKFQDSFPPFSAKNFYVIEVLGGCLCILAGTVLTSRNDFWVMKEYGRRESWTKVVITISYSHMKPLGFLKEDEALLELHLSSLRLAGLKAR
ncbi:hypothetical protein P3X46_027739 [Hevea brasiliensis]|uniref:F-box domain-containing protein n=1 Tax=Hevea brasiliensis TaxID=3981 RepID=A0ABQ9L3Y8_HEVBR|nr:hypothetical protein P3X46_027739 [Hevea brasiliensis]